MLSRLAAALILAVAVSSAQAAVLVRISGKGTDAAGCGGVAAPCRTLQFAHDQVDAGGYIVAVDPADYGGGVITKSITITNESAGAAVISPSLFSSALVIDNMVAVTVRLRGVTLRGNAGMASSTGILFGGNGRLEISDCAIVGFSSSGVKAIGPAKALIVTNSSISNTVGVGIKLESLTPGPQTSAFLDNVRATNNGVGISSLSSPGPISLVVNRSSLSGHRADPNSAAVRIDGSTSAQAALIRNSIIQNNSIGVTNGFSSGKIELRNSAIVSNGSAATSLIGGLVSSYGDNVIRGNADDALGVFTPATLH